MGKTQFDLYEKSQRGIGRYKKEIGTILKYASILSAFLIGCDDPFGDDRKTEPQFIYSCVDAEADYACADPGYYDYVDHLGHGYVMDLVAVGSQFYMDYGREPIYRDDDYTYDYDDEYYSGEGVLRIGATVTAISAAVAPDFGVGLTLSGATADRS